MIGSLVMIGSPELKRGMYVSACRRCLTPESVDTDLGRDLFPLHAQMMVQPGLCCLNVQLSIHWTDIVRLSSTEHPRLRYGIVRPFYLLPLSVPAARAATLTPLNALLLTVALPQSCCLRMM